MMCVAVLTDIHRRTAAAKWRARRRSASLHTLHWVAPVCARTSCDQSTTEPPSCLTLHPAERHLPTATLHRVALRHRSHRPGLHPHPESLMPRTRRHWLSSTNR